jgi:flagellin
MVQTAEGALTEMNTMLNSIRSLAVHAANTGANDANSIMADQTAVDKAIESIQRIAVTTKFAGKYLLDGTAGTTITDQGGTLTNLSVGTVGNSGVVQLSVNTIASIALYTLTVSTTAGVFQSGGVMSIWMETSGVAATIQTITIATDSTQTNVAAMINGSSAATGLWASFNGDDDFTVGTCSYGSNQKVRVVASASMMGAGGALNDSDAGQDLAANIDGVALTGSGLVIYGSSGSTWANTSITLSTADNATANFSLSVVTGSLKFSLTDNASTADLITYSIRNMQTDNLGSTAQYGNSGIEAIKSGQTYDLATNPEAAIVILDKAIADVSMERATLGAFQKFTLETTLNNLGVTRENLAASESRIRDVDMAQEMMDFTKNQILVQAGTAMLAQANLLPQTVLKLLG